MRLAVLFAILLIAAPAALPAHPGHDHHDGPTVVVLDESNWDAYAPRGKEVDAIYGDAVLHNGVLTAVVAEPLPTRHANMTVRDVGGALIDLSAAERPSDQLSAFYPGRRKYPFNGRTTSSGRRERVVDGKKISTAYAEVTVRSPAAEGRAEVAVTYRLEGDAPYLSVITRFTNPHEKPLTVDLQDELRIDGGKEDMQRSPGGRQDLFYVADRYWGQAYGIDAPGRMVAGGGDSRTSVLEYERDGESIAKLPPGESFELVRRIIPGRNLLAVRAVHDRLRGVETAPVTVQLRDGRGEPVAGALVEVHQGEQTRGSARTDEDGRLKTHLPAGRYELHAEALGVSLTDDEPIRLDVGRGGDEVTKKVSLENWQPGRVVAEVTDAEGRPIPCKVEFRPREGTPRPYFGPESAVFGVLNVRYAPHGKLAQQLPAGTYDVIVSHGPEYDALFRELSVPEGGDVELTGRLARTVDTTGWVSSDFHSHSSPSGDNTSSQLGRVVNLVCEHIEFAPCTEHNRVETYEPEIKELGVGDRVATVSGIELTGSPLPLNHQNAFPMLYKPHTQDGGAPVTDVDPTAQIERLALWDDRSEKLIQQNHPDIGWLFYDRDGDGDPDGGFERSHVHIDVMEIHPVHAALELGPVEYRNGKPFGNNRVFNWLQLLNQGYRIPGVVNTDAHYNYHGSGGLRNWIASSTDDPAQIDPMEMVRAAEAGRLVMSNGPFLEFTLSATGESNGSNKPAMVGDELAAGSGELTAHVRVQCPNWLDVDRVVLLVNGRPHPEHDYRRSEHPEKFRSGVVKFDEKLALALDGDAHVVAVAGGEGQKVGPVMGPFWGGFAPAAITNPIFVDVDGGGFRPNKDTLGHPLPVKFNPRR